MDRQPFRRNLLPLRKPSLLVLQLALKLEAIKAHELDFRGTNGVKMRS